MKNIKVCAFGKEIKKKLVDLDQTQDWLIEQVKTDTGLFFDSSYLHKILTGKLQTPKIIESISKILNIEAKAVEQMDGNFFTPEKGKKYLNLNGLHYNCIGHDEEGRAWMQSDNKDKWTFVAVGCRQYKDGTMDWCHGLRGHFEK